MNQIIYSNSVPDPNEFLNSLGLDLSKDNRDKFINLLNKIPVQQPRVCGKSCLHLATTLIDFRDLGLISDEELNSILSELI